MEEREEKRTKELTEKGKLVRIRDMARKFDFNGTHVPPPYMDRSFNGAENMMIRKSAQEAPEVSMYDYNNVGNIECLAGMVTDFDLLGVDQHSTSLYGHVGKERKPTYNADTLLNDAWFCVLSDDGGKLFQILNTLKSSLGIPYPADHPFTNMFGTTTLWEKIHDMELKINNKTREDARRLFSMFHK
jgi:hypothetical protein